MWTMENCGRCDRSRPRYPKDLTDEEWALAGPLIAPASVGASHNQSAETSHGH